MSTLIKSISINKKILSHCLVSKKREDIQKVFNMINNFYCRAAAWINTWTFIHAFITHTLINYSDKSSIWLWYKIYFNTKIIWMKFVSFQNRKNICKIFYNFITVYILHEFHLILFDISRTASRLLKWKLSNQNINDPAQC